MKISFLACLTLVQSAIICNRGQPPMGQWYNYTIPPYQEGASVSLSPEFQSLLQEKFDYVLNDMLTTAPPGSSEFSLGSEQQSWVFYGSGSRALAMLRVYKNSKDPSHLQLAKGYIDQAISEVKFDDEAVGFLKSHTGLYSVGAVVYSLLGGHDDTVDQYIAVVRQAFQDNQLQTRSTDSYDVGLSGLMYCATFLNSFFGTEVISSTLKDGIATLIYNIGVEKSKQQGNTDYLQWDAEVKGWFGQGAGQGGALYALLQTKSLMANAEVYARVSATVDEFYQQQDPITGQYEPDYEDRVQWCHGAPGFIPLMGLASEVLQNDTYLESARRAADFTMEKGIILKGWQLGHGTAGNIYMVFDLYRRTGEKKWLYVAYQLQMTAFGIDTMSDFEGGTAFAYDCAPNSAFIGVYGAVPAWSDMLAHLDDPENNFMPGVGLEW